MAGSVLLRRRASTSVGVSAAFQRYTSRIDPTKEQLPHAPEIERPYPHFDWPRLYRFELTLASMLGRRGGVHAEGGA